MKILEINTVNIGSTGGIMNNIAQKATESGITVYTLSKKWYGFSKYSLKGNQKHFFVNTLLESLICSRICHLLGIDGLLFKLSTYLFFRKNKENFDLIHLHNLHGTYINLPMLFKYIKKKQIPVVWTLHDCWAFTGRCPHFVMSKCDKWKCGCFNCPYPPKSYPPSFYDSTKLMWKLKKKWFTGIKNCTIVTPSQWLANLVKQSYLKDYPVRVINNGIDLSIFKPTENDFRKRHNLLNKKIVLGVAFGWGARKGLDVFIELAQRLPSDYQIVLVGTDDSVDKQLPANILSIHRTQNQKELAEIYTASDVFANPTREEVLGLVNIESLACGTPVVTFRTGGSPECIDETCGSVVDCDDVNAMEIEIRRICEEKPYSKEACILHSKKFDKDARFKEYMELYKEIMRA